MSFFFANGLTLWLRISFKFLRFWFGAEKMESNASKLYRRKLKILPNEEIYCNVDSQVPQAFLLPVFRVTLGNHYSNSFLSVFNDLDLVWYTRYKNIKSMSNWLSNSKQAELAPEPWGGTAISHVMQTFNILDKITCLQGNEQFGF